MDFRKYDGVVGGVEQGAIQLTKYAVTHGHQVILLCKQHRLDQVNELFGKMDGLIPHPLSVRSHVMSYENAKLDSGYIQDLAEKENVDVIHFYYNWAFPAHKKAPCLLTVHDVIPFTFREAMGFFRNKFIYKPSLRKACRLNDLIATVSEYSKQDIARKVGVPLNKIRVIPNGLREPNPSTPEVREALQERFGIDKPFILNVGGIHERKNIVRLIQAYTKLVKDKGFEGKLLITGSISGAPYQIKMKKLCDAAVEASGLKDRIIFTGFITEVELDELLRAAGVFVYPSLYEGFGIPILEAMKVGTPVVTSTATAMPEVAGDAAVLADPYNVDDMAEQMARVLEDKKLREKLRKNGFKRVEPYTWDATCSEYIRTYEELAGSS